MYAYQWPGVAGLKPVSIAGSLIAVSPGPLWQTPKERRAYPYDMGNDGLEPINSAREMLANWIESRAGCIG